MNGFADPISRRIIPEGEGVVLLNRFKLLRYVGAGSVGAVYEAFDSNRSERVAIKVFYPVLVADKETREKLLATAVMNAKLECSGVVKVYDTYRGNGLYWYSMEWIENGSLREYLDRSQQEESPISLEEAVELVGELVSTLTKVLATTVHIAIKPENIFRKPGGDLVLADFGFQSCLGRSRASFSCLVTSSVAYQAAEVLKQDGQVGAAADQFSVAAILYEMLSGSPPLGLSDFIHLQRKGVPKALESVVNRALSPIAKDRFGSLTEFKEALDRSREFPRWILNMIQLGAVFVLGGIVWLLLAMTLPDSTIAKSFQYVFEDTDRSQVGRDAEALWNQAVIRMLQCDRALESAIAILDNEENRGQFEYPPGKVVGFPFDKYRKVAVSVWSPAERGGVSEALTLSRRDLDQGRISEVMDSAKPLVSSISQALGNLELLQQYFRLTIEGRRVGIGMAQLKSSSAPIERWLTINEKSAPFLESNLSGVPLGEYYDYVEEMRIDASMILSEAEGRAQRMQEHFVSKVGASTTPPLHVGDPVGLMVEAQSMNEEPASWRERFDAYSDAAGMWETWCDEFQSLPVPPGVVLKENSIHMRFVPLKPNLWVSIYETRLIDIETFVQSTGYDTDRHWRWLHDEFKQQSPFEPAVNMKLDLVTDFCIWLTEYELEQGLISDGDQYRLPSIEEWVSASQGGIGPGNRLGIEDGYEFTSPVGRFPPNRLGLYDMDGNVGEWCLGGLEVGMPSMYWGYVPGASWMRASVSSTMFDGHPGTYHLSRDLGFRVVLELAQEERDG